MALAEDKNTGVTTGSTPVTMVASPGVSTKRIITGFSVYNADTVDAAVTIQYKDNATTRTIFKATLTTGDNLTWGREDAPIVLSDTNDSLEIVLGGAVTTNELPFTAYYADIT